MSFVRVFVVVTVFACASCSTGGGWSGDPVPLCVRQCDTPADCEFGGDSVHDADNFQCVAGMCRYIGCLSDAECSKFSPSVCRVTAYADYPVCTAPCTTVDDCVSTASATLDADNWACEAGACQHLGCNSDAECGPAGACLQPGDGTPARCIEYCETALDCVEGGASVAYNEDNYRCVQNRCEYLGCHSDTECQASEGAALCVDP